MMNIRGFNKLAKEHNLRLVQDKGYLWWEYTDDRIAEPPPSIYVYKFSHLHKSYKGSEQPLWVEELDSAIKFIKDNKEIKR